MADQMKEGSMTQDEIDRLFEVSALIETAFDALEKLPSSVGSKATALESLEAAADALLACLEGRIPSWACNFEDAAGEPDHG